MTSSSPTSAIAKATALRDVTWGRLVKGKFAYMSPEQVAGEAVTAASDQFALGITLHELLLGRRPFDGAGPLATMENIRRAPLPDDPELDGPAGPAARMLLRRSLAEQPGDRLPDLEALSHELQACATGSRRPVRSRWRGGSARRWSARASLDSAAQRTCDASASTRKADRCIAVMPIARRGGRREALRRLD